MATDILSHPQNGPAINADDQANMLLRQIDLSHELQQIESRLENLKPDHLQYQELVNSQETLKQLILNLSTATRFARTTIARSLDFGNFNFDNYTSEDINRRIKITINKRRKRNQAERELSPKQKQIAKDAGVENSRINEQIEVQHKRVNRTSAENQINRRAKSTKPKSKRPFDTDVKVEKGHRETHKKRLGMFAKSFALLSKAC